MSIFNVFGQIITIYTGNRLLFLTHVITAAQHNLLISQTTYCNMCTREPVDSQSNTALSIGPRFQMLTMQGFLPTHGTDQPVV